MLASSLIQWLVTPQAQEIWVKRGGSISASKSVPLSSYPDETARRSAEILTTAKVFRFATSTDAATLDPHATNALFTYLIVSQVYEPLTHRGDDLTLHPGLAVRWEQVVRRLASEGVRTYVEVGPGTVLTGLVRKIDREAQVMNVEDEQGLPAIGTLFASHEPTA